MLEIWGKVERKSEQDVLNEVIGWRFKQDYVDRLCEYITGMRLDNLNLPYRLECDQKIIRTKYGLPDRETRFRISGDYENYLRELAKVNGIYVRPRSECGDYFKKYEYVSGVFFDEEKIIGIDLKRIDLDAYQGDLGTFEHEIIHALQDKYYPRMPIELKEYEAYVACYNIEYFKEKPKAIEVNFSFGIAGSVNHYYRRASEEAGEKIEPVWNNPEYFLKNIDGISDEKIEKYRFEHQSNEEDGLKIPT